MLRSGNPPWLCEHKEEAPWPKARDFQGEERREGMMAKNKGDGKDVGFEKINTGRPLFLEVVRQIEKRVMSGDLEPGDMLPPERVMADQFGVSRTVIREAAKALELRGLVEVQHGRGVQISRPTAKEFGDSMFRFVRIQKSPVWALHELRSILEIGMVRLAAMRRTDEDLVQLRDLVEDMERTVDKPLEYVEVDLEFHKVLTAAAHNPLMGPMLEPLSKLMIESRRIGALAPDAPRRSIASHRAIVKAIEEQDADQAVEVMKEHFDRIARFLMEGESHEGEQYNGIDPVAS
jgi:GntR family transcriptional repressor for pyruvate dehydrogenase complex